MPKVLLRFVPFLMAASAFAQAQAPEAPAEKASMLTVVIFLLLFFGSCAGYFVYLWWNHRKNPQPVEPPR
jgi:hypothetical protein